MCSINKVVNNRKLVIILLLFMMRTIVLSSDNGASYVQLNASHDNERTKLSEGFLPSDDYNNSYSETTVIKFYLSQPGFVNIKIYDNKGNTIEEIARSSFSSGVHEVVWNKSKFPKNSYYYSIITGDYSETKKIQN